MNVSESKSYFAMKIIVVGGGVVGLTTALSLLEAGHRDVKIMAESFDDTTSHVAGAVWRPFALSENSSTEAIDRWGHATMLWLTKIMEQYGTDTVGVQRTPGCEYHDHPTTSHPYWAHSVENFRFLTPDEAQAQGNTPYGFSYTTLMINPGKLMLWMRRQIEMRGGRFEQAHVTNLDELQCDYIVNCTGLGSGQLLNDKNVFPVRGQTIKIQNDQIKNFYLREIDHVYTYILPRPGGQVVLGGTVEAHNYSTTCNQEDIKAILARTSSLCPAVVGSKILGTKAGLRPQTTTGVVLKADSRRNKHGALVIHNYGHGGSGHTLHWGCAQEVLQWIVPGHAKL
ncbi:D-aspartate oxidase [Thraustotheca clavata]|uniref:D-aspartate oxidase n=1 Tax=Thraustotheca clavata TaxID=74557 RepID=A0A1W0A012_9STRA|nr:D-aspartate oxidase [Thraustotheca clavata]